MHYNVAQLKKAKAIVLVISCNTEHI